MTGSSNTNRGQERGRGQGKERGRGRGGGRGRGRGRGRGDTAGAAREQTDFSNSSGRGNRGNRGSRGSRGRDQASGHREGNSRGSDEFEWITKVSKSEHPLAPNMGERFLRLAIKMAKLDPMGVCACISTETGVLRLNEALLSGEGPEFLETYVTPLLELLGGDSFARLLFERRLLMIIKGMFLQTPLLVESLAESLPYLFDPTPVEWALLWLLAREQEAVMRSPEIKVVADVLESGCNRPRLKQLLAPRVESATAASDPTSQQPAMTQALADIRENGGRHSNDSPNWREINVVPHSDELACRSPPYLPTVSTIQSIENEYFGCQYRLLREDMVGPMREILEKLRLPNPPALVTRHVFRICRLSIPATFGKFVGLTVAFQLPPGHRFVRAFKKKLQDELKEENATEQQQIATKSKLKRKMIDFWDIEKRTLPHDSLVCILHKTNPVALGRICGRKSEDLIREPPEVQVRFDSKRDFEKCLELLNSDLKDYSIVAICDSFFSFEHILGRLQKMEQLPFREEILDQVPDRPACDQITTKLSPDAQIEKLKNSSAKIVLEEFQEKAFRLALTRRFSLIQGPPGTGKTFIGGLLAQAVLSETSLTLFCVCYTNHALDQFLTILLNAGVGKLVRVGGKTKDPLIDKFSIHKLAEDSAHSQAQRRYYGMLKREMENLAAQIAGLVNELRSDVNWAALQNYLVDHDGGALAALSCSRTDADGMSIVGRNGRAIAEDDAFKSWRKGDRAPGYLSNESAAHEIWRLSKQKRKDRITQWENDMKNTVRKKLAKLSFDHNQTRMDVEVLNRESWISVLKGARVIGCTTSGAAKYVDILNEVRLDVAIIEEAAEILEAHTVTSLTQSVKHVIMIGDHLQLRPKVQHYPLQLESGRGFNFNMSLFERLARGGFKDELVTLRKQHRMRPEISSLIHGTYPNLMDAPSVENRPTINGIQDVVVFIDHRQPEEGQEKKDRAETSNQDAASVAASEASKVNRFEVKLVVATVRYLLQQGYQAGNMVVITPYLGQLLELRRALSADMKVLMNDADLRDLAKLVSDEEDEEEEEEETSPVPPAKSIRVTTIDNFQGEEADIVIGSLVRSNANDSIGFLKEPERLNVLLSRARNGLLLIGNSETLCGAKGKGGLLWSGLMDKLSDGNHVYPGLPIVCQRHSAYRRTLQSDKDFVNFSPNGGCTLACTATLGCGHPCPRCCHPGDHSSVKCQFVVESTCDVGHSTMVRCGEEGCSDCEALKRQKETEQRLLNEKLAKDKKIRKAHQANVAKVEKEIAKLQLEITELDTKMQNQRDLANLEEKLAQMDIDLSVRRVRDPQILEEEAKESAEALERQLRERKEELAQAARKKNNAPDVLNRELQSNQNSYARTSEKARKAKAPVDIVQRAEALKPTLEAIRSLCDGKPQPLKQLLASIRKGKDSPLKMVLGSQELVDPILQCWSQRSPTPSLKSLGPNAGGSWLALQAKVEGSSDDSSLVALEGVCNYNLSRDEAESSAALLQLARSHLQPGEVCPTVNLLEGFLYSSSPHRQASLLISFLVSSDAELFEVCRTVAQKTLKTLQASLKLDRDLVVQDTAAREKSEWERLASRSAAFKTLMELVGLKPVKQHLVRIYNKVQLDKERGLEFKKANYNVVFYGNPGTGKTTVARIYAKLLCEIGVLSGDGCEETSGAKLAQGGVKATEELVNKLDKGGVLFIDEAYQLKPSTDREGAKVLDYLLPEIENRRGKLVVVLAGYQKQMEELLQYNEGLPSRFPEQFTFPDYNRDELLQILNSIIASEKPKQFSLEDPKHARIAATRLARQAEQPGFANAREVRNLYERTKSRQASRILEERKLGERPNTMLIKRDDLLGARSLSPDSEALQNLEKMCGLDAVKKEVRSLLDVVAKNADLEEREQPVRELTLNKVFLGNPGTGKTTVAKLYGQILRDLGLLSKGDVIVRNPSDFLGSVLGESEKKTNQILEASRGNVLVIDEAYGLASGKGTTDPYKTAVIDTIVAQVQGVPGDDRCVVMIGYKKQMEDMMRDANPGLARRFQLRAAWEFHDYSPDDLIKIFSATCQRKGIKAPIPVLRRAGELLKQESMMSNFGNAGAVQNMIANAQMRMDQRLQEAASSTPQDQSTLIPEDLEDERATASEEMFSDLVGCDEIVNKLQEYQKTIAFAKKTGIDPRDMIPMCFQFVGPPGTGKTTVARKMGEMFHSLGLLPAKEVVQCSASDFSTGFVGQAAGKTREIFQSALGKTLFIDEAYRLNPGSGPASFAQEIIDEIVQLLTEDQFHGKMAVIFAGYEDDMELLMGANSGLRSRVPERMTFYKFTVEHSCDLLIKSLKHPLTISQELKGQLPRILQPLVDHPDFSSGRDIVTLSKSIFRLHAQSPTENDELALATLTQATTKLFESKPSSRSKTATRMPRPADPTQTAYAGQTSAPPPRASTRTAVETAVEAAEESSEDSDSPPADRIGEEAGFFQNVDKAFTDALQDVAAAAGVSAQALDEMAPEAPTAVDVVRKVAEKTGTGVEEALRQLEAWKKGMKEARAHEAEMEARSRRPVWRCAACGSYQCGFRPYIERYEEF